MSDDLTLWQEVLAAEHVAIYGYGLIGAVPEMSARAMAALVVHRQRRAACIEAIAGLGGTPVSSAAAYDVRPPAGPEAARVTAAALEAGCWPAYLGLVGATARRPRLTAAGWLRQSTVAAQAWDGTVAALPGY